ncbi:ORIGIN RECOGNITION COMPLEX SUBUNIT [Babesia ovata]|uniref:Origin recognition complex subunit 2 n=1 Tax=Babesia ovata TaxID=189622 RepID=A0A2H6KI05_9APIC|nr:ORIGIN RECOGNITION COMPLEX SUBUNIT [Babesia ovata]GBE62626.1 ORIGIN RECOGNITION COMPLEX SUBUNIT [Babesia ovata]
MVWEAVEVKLPQVVSESLALDARQRSAYAPNVQVKHYSSSERARSGEKDPLIPEGELHELMKEHVNWLLDQFSHSAVHLEITYGAPRAKIHSPTCYMFGLKSEYMHSGKLPELDVPKRNKEVLDPILAAATAAIFEKEVHFSDPSSVTEPVKETAEGPKVDSTSRDVDMASGIEISDDEASGDNECSSGTESDRSDGGVNATRKRQTVVKDRDAPSPSADDGSAADQETLLNHMRARFAELETSVKFEDTIMHDYYAPNIRQQLDTSALESQLFSAVAANAPTTDESSRNENRLDKRVIDILGKGNVVGFSRIVSWIPHTKAKLPPHLLHDMLIWKSWLINGQHLCFYGAGSKRQLIKVFVKFALRDGICLTVDAFRVKGSTGEVFWQLLRRELLSKKMTMTVPECKKAVLKRIATMRKPFYIIVYNFDNLATIGALKLLRALFRISNVRLIATMDNLRSSIVVSLFDQILRRYKLIRLNTGMDYRELASLWERTPPRFIARDENQKSATEMQAIIEALSVNHRQLFSLIAQMQLDGLRSRTRFDGVEKYGLLREPRALTICNSESKLDALLTEFVTHNVG